MEVAATIAFMIILFMIGEVPCWLCGGGNRTLRNARRGLGVECSNCTHPAEEPDGAPSECDERNLEATDGDRKAPVKGQ